MSVHFELIKTIQSLSFCHDLDAVMKILREAARDLTGADGVTVILRDGDQCYYAEENAIAPLWKGRRFPMIACISGWCMIHRQRLAIPDIYKDPRIPHDAYKPTFVRSLAMVPIRSENPIGAIGAYWANHHDASESELELLQALGDSAAMAFANVKLIESLEESNRRKDQFLSMLAHELRSPLFPIRSALYAIGVRPGDSETVEQMREVMERQVQHMSHIIEGLLDVSRLTSGKIKLNRERLDLAQIVRQTIGDRRVVLESSGLKLHIELPDTPVWVMADLTRLVQAISNVLDNAGKFTPRGGKVAVRLSADRESKTAIVSVQDNGIGIDPEILPGVFDVFVQADRSLDRSRGGLGLGLAIAKNLLELHGGSIDVNSEGTGKGAEFKLRVPYEPEPAALATDIAPAFEPPAHRIRILVIEDNADAARVMRVLLELSGYEVVLASNGTDGLAAAKAELPAVVLCDIGLPGMDGYAVASALRQNPQTAATRLIAVTGYGQEEDRRRALAAGFNEHLVKPVDPSILLQQIKIDAQNN